MSNYWGSSGQKKKHGCLKTLYSWCCTVYSAKLFTTVNFLLVADEESTIEEQEIMEGEADHKAELVDLVKDGTYFLYFFVSASLERQDWGGEMVWFPNSVFMILSVTSTWLYWYIHYYNLTLYWGTWHVLTCHRAESIVTTKFTENCYIYCKQTSYMLLLSIHLVFKTLAA